MVGYGSRRTCTRGVKIRVKTCRRTRTLRTSPSRSTRRRNCTTGLTTNELISQNEHFWFEISQVHLPTAAQIHNLRLNELLLVKIDAQPTVLLHNVLGRDEPVPVAVQIVKQKLSSLVLEELPPIATSKQKLTKGDVPPELSELIQFLHNHLHLLPRVPPLLHDFLNFPHLHLPLVLLVHFSKYTQQERISFHTHKLGAQLLEHLTQKVYLLHFGKLTYHASVYWLVLIFFLGLRVFNFNKRRFLILFL